MFVLYIEKIIRFLKAWIKCYISIGMQIFILFYLKFWNGFYKKILEQQKNFKILITKRSQLIVRWNSFTRLKIHGYYLKRVLYNILYSLYEPIWLHLRANLTMFIKIKHIISLKVVKKIVFEYRLLIKSQYLTGPLTEYL